jgi:uncharacterized protein
LYFSKPVQSAVSKQHNPLRLNVGFIIHETPGFTRDFEFDFPHLELSPDLPVKDFKGKISFSRTQKGILAEASFTATFPLECARCLDPILNTITSDFTELFALKESSETEEELIIPEDGYIDFTPIVREYLLLDMPHKPVCREDCAGLCPICGANHNETQCDCKTEDIDPRLSKLKDLLDNDE